MKNSLKKMLGIFLGIIIFYNNFCYADEIIINPVEISIRYLIIIAIVVLVISGILYFVLRATASKENEDEDTMLNVDRKIIFVSSFIIVVMASVVYVVEEYSDYHFPIQIFIVVMVMFVLSIILKIIKKKKLANILIVISALTMCIASTYTSINSRTRETPPEYKITVFNSKFTKYEGDRVPGTQVKGLIEDVLAINDDESYKASNIYVSLVGDTGKEVTPEDIINDKRYEVKAYRGDGERINKIVVSESAEANE